MRFYDPVNKRELTIYNIVSWINRLINNAESVGWSELVNSGGARSYRRQNIGPTKASL